MYFNFNTFLCYWCFIWTHFGRVWCVQLFWCQLGFENTRYCFLHDLYAVKHPSCNNILNVLFLFRTGTDDTVAQECRLKFIDKEIFKIENPPGKLKECLLSNVHIHCNTNSCSCMYIFPFLLPSLIDTEALHVEPRGFSQKN